jgi:hypothetical protein
MSKTTTRKTLGNTRFFIQYLDEKGDKITLSLRSEKSLKEHMKQNKLSKSDIIYKSNKAPYNDDLYPCASKIRSAISTFESCYGSQEEFAIV